MSQHFLRRVENAILFLLTVFIVFTFVTGGKTAELTVLAGGLAAFPGA